MRFLKLAFASFWSAIPLMFLYCLSCAIATFIENDYGTPVAKALVYDTWWFSFLHLYLLIVLLGSLFVSRTLQRKKYASFVLHLSFVVIILGAGVTRYFGFEGVMHIREGEQSSHLLSSETYINLIAQKDGKQEKFHIPANLIAGQKFEKNLKVFGQAMELRVEQIVKLSRDKKDATSAMTLALKLNGQEEQVRLVGGIGIEGKPMAIQLKDELLFLSWGVRKITLPFSLFLKDFQLDRYAGSMSPSSYASEVEIIDDRAKINQSFRIYMNNVLDYDNYRFFQSSYDTDEKGTILSVNNDPGKNITYLGYTLLILGCILLLFDPDGRFRRLGYFLKSQKVLSFTLFAMLSIYPIYGQDDLQSTETISNLKTHSKAFVEEFNSLLVQDYGGRIKPINTLATDMIHKITKTDNFLGFSNMQLFLGMLMLPDDFQKLKMIKVSTPELRKLLGTQKDYISFKEVFTADRAYILQNYVEEANLKKPSMRNTFDKDVIAVDERVNLAYMIYTGEVFKVFPDAAGSNLWYQPIQAIQAAAMRNQRKEVERIGKILQAYVNGFNEGVTHNKWTEAQKALQEMKEYQEQYGSALIPSSAKIQAEIFLNQNNFFKLLILPYILLGIALFIFVLVCILRNQSLGAKVVRIFYALLVLLSALLTLALLLRWYISDHAPWSNAYESMLYISWASSISAAIFFSRSALAISASLFLSGIALFVANLGFMDPQIGNLVPVLKSYWLNIHVSIITASYGFLGLCFILGLITLVMFVLRSQRAPQVDGVILSLSAINEMAMIFGLFMLTVGNFLGGIWANESWGRYWGWDPKETWALISIGVYAIILHLRFLGFKNMPYILASASVIGFFSILMTYFGVNYYLSGMHSYAAGDPLPIPTFVYILVLGILLLLALAFPKRELEFPALKKFQQ